MGGVAGSLLLLFLLTPAAALAGGRPWPVQLTRAAGSSEYHGGAPAAPDVGVATGAVWLGGICADRSSGRGFFVGPGVEATLDGANGPYQWPIGGGFWVGCLRRGRIGLIP